MSYLPLIITALTVYLLWKYLTIVKTVAKKQDVQLIGFGTFKAAKRAARTGKNPRTGEKLKIAAATVPKFSAGAAFKAAVNKKK